MNALDLDSAWGEKCEQTLNRLSWYGKNGTRNEDSHVIDMLEDTTHDIADFWCYLELVHAFYELQLYEQSVSL